jgi:hypothetical protein
MNACHFAGANIRAGPRAALLWAAVLKAGPGAALSHETAAELHGLTCKPAPLIHVTVPAGRRVEPVPGLIVHRSARIAEARRRARYRRAPGSRRPCSIWRRQRGLSRKPSETDGRLAHAADGQWRDVRRDNAAAADGIVTLRYGWSDVISRPCGVAAEVGAVLARRGWPGPVRRCGPSCALPRP